MWITKSIFFFVTSFCLSIMSKLYFKVETICYIHRSLAPISVHITLFGPSPCNCLVFGLSFHHFFLKT